MENQVIFLINDEDKQLLEKICKKLGLSKSAFIRLKVFKALRQEEFLLKSTEGVNAE